MTRIILTGATGTAGSAILTNALASPQITHVTVLGRRAPAVQSDKLTTILLPSDDFPQGFDAWPPALVERLKDNDAAIWAMGAMQSQIKGQEYVRITKDWTLEAARALSSSLGSTQKPFRFVFMTGMGTTQGARDGWFTQPYVKIKGDTEAALRERESESFKTVFVRPGGIMATEERRPDLIWHHRIILDVLSYVWPSGMIKSTDLADACIRLATGGEGWELRSDEHAIENADLRRLAASYRESLDIAT